MCTCEKTNGCCQTEAEKTKEIICLEDMMDRLVEDIWRESLENNHEIVAELRNKLSRMKGELNRKRYENHHK